MTASLRLPGRIVKAEILRRPVPLRRPIAGVRGDVTTRVVRLLQLTADDGIEGIGEGSTVDWLAATPANDAPVFRALMETIRRDHPTAEDLLEWSCQSSAPPAARSALQTALLDLEARRRGCTMAGLLGAAKGEDLPLSALIASATPEEMARETAAHAARGITCFKIKVGRGIVRDDVERAMAVRSAAPTASLRLDANAAWSAGQAEVAFEAFADVGADFIEEPLAEPAERIRLRPRLRIALDESVRTAADLERALAIGGFDVLVLKLERLGGPIRALALAALAMQNRIEVVFTDSIESEVGRAATVHTAAAAYAIAGRPPSAIGLGGLFVLDDQGSDARRAATVAASVRGPGLGIDIECARSGKPS